MPNVLITRGPASSQGMQDESGAKSGDRLICGVDLVFNFIFLAPVRGKQAFFGQLSFAKLEEFQLIILFCIFILVLNQHRPRKFNSFKSLSTHYPIFGTPFAQ